MKAGTFKRPNRKDVQESHVRSRLRQMLEDMAGHGADSDCHFGWFSSDDHANGLLTVFDALRLKPGFALHTYELREGSDGNGIIWAVPVDAPVVPPQECSWVEENLQKQHCRSAGSIPGFRYPRPPNAIPLMQAIEGDGSPWSYLSASILCREAAEFGARWHGVVWSEQTILGEPPRQAEGQTAENEELNGPPVDEWTWHAPVPPTWKPTYHDAGATRHVVLHIHKGMGRSEVYRARDAYSAGTYVAETETALVCTGGGGWIP